MIRGMDEANTPPFDNFCEVCGEPAELHITEIDKAGQASVRHVCTDHFPGAAVLGQMSEEMRAEFEGMTAKLRATRSKRRRST
jgi:protein-arginine kinase activator protein McsA